MRQWVSSIVIIYFSYHCSDHFTHIVYSFMTLTIGNAAYRGLLDMKTGICHMIVTVKYLRGDWQCCEGHLPLVRIFRGHQRLKQILGVRPYQIKVEIWGLRHIIYAFNGCILFSIRGKMVALSSVRNWRLAVHGCQSERRVRVFEN